MSWSVNTGDKVQYVIAQIHAEINTSDFVLNFIISFFIDSNKGSYKYNTTTNYF